MHAYLTVCGNMFVCICMRFCITILQYIAIHYMPVLRILEVCDIAPYFVYIHTSLQVDVLESQFSLLLQNITSTLDFESIKLAHERFVTTLQGQLFLLMPPVSHVSVM